MTLPRKFYCNSFLGIATYLDRDKNLYQPFRKIMNMKICAFSGLLVRDENTGLSLFISAAMFPVRRLNMVYILTINNNLGMICSKVEGNGKNDMDVDVMRLTTP